MEESTISTNFLEEHPAHANLSQNASDRDFLTILFVVLCDAFVQWVLRHRLSTGYSPQYAGCLDQRELLLVEATSYVTHFLDFIVYDAREQFGM